MTIEEDKKLLGFKTGTSALYKQWRNAIKAHMATNRFTTKREAGNEKWTALTEYALTLKPLSARADVHGTATAAGIAMQQALNNLLVDTAKKLKDTQTLYRDVELLETPVATSSSAVLPAPGPRGTFTVI